MRKLLCVLIGAVFATHGYAAALINDTETERVLYELVAPIANAADIPDGRFNIHIIRDDDFNAFVMGGEDIYVYTGLLKQIKNPNALQAVVAHELGHTIGGHVAQMSERQKAEMKRNMLIQALGVGLMVAGGNPTLGAGVLAGSAGVAHQSMMAFTRDEERIADNLGVGLMARAGQNPNGFVTVLEQMHELTGEMESRINPNMINHPLTTERLNNVRAQIKNTEKNWPDTENTQQNAQYELVRAKLVGYLDAPARVREMYPYADKSDAALYARAIANMQGGNLDAARMGTQTLISRHPNNPYFYELLGDIDYQFGRYDDSVNAYERALALTQDAPQIQTAMALVLVERNKPGDAARALDLCRRSILAVPAPLTYWVMARAYGDADPGRHAWAMAEYSQMIGKSDDAIKYAKTAKRKLSKTDAEYVKSDDILNSAK